MFIYILSTFRWAGCVCVCVMVRGSWGGEIVGERSCRHGDGGAGEQMTLTAERNLAATVSRRGTRRGRLREPSSQGRPKNSDKIDKKR